MDSHAHTHTQRNYSARAQAHKYTPVAINTREAKKKVGGGIRLEGRDRRGEVGGEGGNMAHSFEATSQFCFHFVSPFFSFPFLFSFSFLLWRSRN